MKLKVHFLNVGHGDCTLIEFPSGRFSVIDINNSRAIDKRTESELAAINSYKYNYYKSLGYTGTKLLSKSISNFVEPIDPIDYISDHIPSKDIFRFILTHPHFDHMTGLYKLETEGIHIENFWDTNNNRVVKEDDDMQGYDYRDWKTYQKWKKSKLDPKALTFYKGDSKHYFGEYEDNIKILSPTSEIVVEANEKEDWNMISYILVIGYAGHKIVLGGDAERNIWDRLAKSDSTLLKDISILKAPHHGRKSAYSQKAVSIMKPEWTICSIGKLPDQNEFDGYRYYTKKKVLSTRFRGNIVAEIQSNGELEMYCESNFSEDEGLYPL